MDIQTTLGYFQNGSTPTVVAVIPAYNEERFIASVVIKTKQYASHVIVVDDGSSDLTATLANEVGAEVIVQPVNQGKAAALNTGFQAALAHFPDAIVCLDADAQHEPSDIPQVVQPILKQEADVVVGSRFLDVKSDIPQWRQFGQYTLTAVTNTLSGLKISDSQSGFRAFSMTAAKALKFSSEGLSVESEMQFLFEPAGLRVMEAPISVRYLDGNKRNPVVHGLRVLDAMVSLVAKRRPLAFFSLPGLMIASAGLVLGVYVVHMMLSQGSLLIGTAILTALLIISGILLGITGLILHSLGTFVERVQTGTAETVVNRILSALDKKI
jgi:glycosyltransferase involved in cell wall biosynthesis